MRKPRTEKRRRRRRRRVGNDMDESADNNQRAGEEVQDIEEKGAPAVKLWPRDSHPTNPTFLFCR